MMLHEYKEYQNKYKLPIAILKTRCCEFVSHWHPDFEIAFVLNGTMEASVNGVFFHLQRGEALVCANGDIHSDLNPSPESEVMILMMDQVAFQRAGYPSVGPAAESCIFSDEGKSHEHQLFELLDEICAEYNALDANSVYYLYSGILHIQGILHRYFSRRMFLPPIPGGERDKIRHSLSYLEDNFTNPVTLEEAARQAGMTDTDYSRKFKNVVGIGFKHYLNLLRLRNAEYLLRKGNRSITDVAFDSGFNSIRTFNRVFFDHFGVSPREIYGKSGTELPAAPFSVE